MPYRLQTQPGDPDHPLLVIAFRGRVIAVDAVTGRQVWKYIVGGAHGDLVKLWVNRERVIAVANPRLACLDYLSGHEYWRWDVGPVSSALLVTGEKVFVAGDGHVRCFTMDGEPLWNERVMGHEPGPFSIGVPGRAVHD